MKIHRLGFLAEKYVASCLRLKGWELLSHRYKGVGFEIDIIGKKNGVLVFFEVKFRKYWKDGLVDFEMLFPYKKKKALLLGARHFITYHNVSERNYRFDLVILSLKENQFKIMSYHQDVCLE